MNILEHNIKRSIENINRMNLQSSRMPQNGLHWQTLQKKIQQEQAKLDGYFKESDTKSTITKPVTIISNSPKQDFAKEIKDSEYRIKVWQNELKMPQHKQHWPRLEKQIKEEKAKLEGYKNPVKPVVVNNNTNNTNYTNKNSFNLDEASSISNIKALGNKEEAVQKILAKMEKADPALKKGLEVLLEQVLRDQEEADLKPEIKDAELKPHAEKAPANSKIVSDQVMDALIDAWKILDAKYPKDENNSEHFVVSLRGRLEELFATAFQVSEKEISVDVDVLERIREHLIDPVDYPDLMADPQRFSCGHRATKETADRMKGLCPYNKDGQNPVPDRELQAFIVAFEKI